MRTLRHYDEIGLLRPSARTENSPRRYTSTDAARLQQVLALRALGLALPDIGRVLNGAGPPIGDLLDAQLRGVQARLDADRRLRRLLRAVQAAAVEESSPVALTDKIKELSDLMNRFTPEQREELEQGRARMMAALSENERREMAERRNQAMAQLSAPERRALAESRAAVMGDESVDHEL